MLGKRQRIVIGMNWEYIKMELIITTLIENEEDERKCLKNEHGLSLYLEYDGDKILFDTGQTGNFVDNAAVLGKTLDNLDYVVLPYLVSVHIFHQFRHLLQPESFVP